MEQDRSTWESRTGCPVCEAHSQAFPENAGLFPPHGPEKDSTPLSPPPGKCPAVFGSRIYLEQVWRFFRQEQERPGRWAGSHRPGQELRSVPAARTAELKAVHALQEP